MTVWCPDYHRPAKQPFKWQIFTIKYQLLQMVLFTIIIIRTIATVDATTITGINSNSRSTTNDNKYNHPIENSNRLKAAAPVTPITFLDDYVDDDVNSKKISNNKNNIDDDGNIQCPSHTDNSACSCYKSEKGVILQCDSTTSFALRSILHPIKVPIQSLLIYDFDSSVTFLSSDIFTSGMQVLNLQFTHSELMMLEDNSLQHLRTTLESLSLVNAKLNEIPKDALTGMQSLISLDLEGNNITEIQDYSFFGLRLQKLNIKDNALRKVPEYAFAGLEESLAEADFSENKLKTFPMSAIKKLDKLSSLRLSSNEIVKIQCDRKVRLTSLKNLDVSANRIEEIDTDCLQIYPNLETINLYQNSISRLQRNTFNTLASLTSLDISYNNIIHLESKLFDSNKKLETVDMSFNHIHYINNIFINLPELRAITLSENNILDLPANAFANSTKLHTIYLESNAIATVDAHAFNTLNNLEQLHLSSNFIEEIPQTLFSQAKNLTTLILNRNQIRDLVPGTFQPTDNLNKIHLHSNKVEIIKASVFSPLSSLLELHLQNNLIRTIETDAFVSLKNLQNINLQGNQLTTLVNIFPHDATASLLTIQLDANCIDDMHNDSFMGLQKIQLLWLADNQLNKLDKQPFRDLGEIEKLYLRNNSIKIIQPDVFENMKALRYLDLGYNKLRQIKRFFFMHVKALEELILSANKISEIQAKSFINLKQLRILDLSHNRIFTLTGDVFAEGLPIFRLFMKNCSLSKITSDTFVELKNISDLNLESNNLTLYDIKQLELPSLRTLRVSHNNFTQIVESVFDKLPSLQTILMANCSIFHLPVSLFQRNKNLIKIDMGGNLINALDRYAFAGLTKFRELEISGNILRDFPYAALNNIVTLDTLSMSNNMLSSIDFFKFKLSPNLRQWNLRENNISSLTGFSTVNLTKLDFIDLSANALVDLPRDFFQNSVSLQRIDLSLNRLRQIPSYALSDNALPRLVWLNLTGNPITNIYAGTSHERYTYLREIYLSQMNLTSLSSQDFDSFPALQELDLTDNQIYHIETNTFKNLQKLLKLDISRNRLERLPKNCLVGLRQLHLLNVSSNLMNELDEFSDELVNLKVLDISFNHVNSIDIDAFKNLHGLMKLILMGNRLATISSDAFKMLKSLTILDARRNYFKTIPLGALKTVETHIQNIKIYDNPLHCSCDTKELWKWLKDHRKCLLLNDQRLQCEQPSVLHGKVLTDMNPDDFCVIPLILDIAVQDLQPNSLNVSWAHGESSDLNGFEIFYQALDNGIDDTRWSSIRFNHLADTAKLNDLLPSTIYRICVMALTDRLPTMLLIAHTLNATENLLPPSKQSKNTSLNLSPNDVIASQSTYDTNVISNDVSHSNRNKTVSYNQNIQLIHTLLKLQTDTSITRCTEARTLDAAPKLQPNENGLSGHGLIHSLLTRRLGLIVGCVLGIFVFIVLISVLGCMKLKRKRIENAKRQQQQQLEQTSLPPSTGPHLQLPVNYYDPQQSLHHGQIPPPPDYNMSYTHITAATTILPPHDETNYDEFMCHQHPNFMSGIVMGTTPLNC